MNKLIEEILLESGFEKNNYFKSLNDGSFEKEDFIETQIQFYYAVIFFSRPMAALAAKIPSPLLRLEVLRNVWEEHGEGDHNKIHAATFLEFLLRVGAVKPAQIEERTLWPEIRIFNTTLAGACVLDEYLIGCGVLGMIERMFCEISSWIGTSVVKRGWLSSENMVHYNLHKDLDIKHSQDFFNVLQPSWDQNPENHYLIEQGLRLGATVFNGLYEGLYAQRKRRLYKSLPRPNSIA